METELGSGMDKIVEAMLPKFGYACEVGANNGVNRSNTLLFEDKGWIVLCIEPNPLLAEEGRKNRNLWKQVACGAVNADNVLFTACGEYPWAGGSGFHPYTNDLPKQEFRVPMRRLDSLLLEAHFPMLHFLSIDVEWAEMEVFRGFSFEDWQPTVIVAEALAKDQEMELKLYLASKGYEFVTQSGYDYCFRLKA